MKKITLLFILSILTCFLLSSASANYLNPLFSKQYERTKGKPNVYTDIFDAVPGDAVLRVENGSGEQVKTRVSNAEIWLNGVQLFGPADFNNKVRHLEKTVNLTENNSLEVVLKGKPGSFLMITLTSSTAPAPTVTISADPVFISAGDSSTLSWTQQF